MAHITLNTPVGILSIFGDDEHIHALDWGRVPDGDTSAVIDEAAKQVRAYFDETLTVFDLPLDPAGSAFQKDVCKQMCMIPYGEQWTYGQIGKALGKPAQAVGGACGRNPIPIIIPCHRVVASNGNMTGFSGGDGVDTKIWLLQHEGAIIA